MKQRNTRTGNKREAIIEAAVQVFSSKGYHNTRMEEIAAAAGIGKGTIYEYFDSKLQLFQEMLTTSLQIYYKSFDIKEMGKLSVAKRIELLIKAHIEFCKENKELTRIVFWDNGGFDEELREWFKAMRKEKEQRMKIMIEEGISSGEFREVNTYLATLMVLGTMGSIWVPITIEDWEIDSEVLAGQIADIIMNGIQKQGDVPLFL